MHKSIGQLVALATSPEENINSNQIEFLFVEG